MGVDVEKRNTPRVSDHGATKPLLLAVVIIRVVPHAQELSLASRPLEVGFPTPSASSSRAFSGRSAGPPTPTSAKDHG